MPSNLWRHTGAIWPVGIPTSLTWYDLGAIMHILRVARVRTVIEIGIEHGGTSGLLMAHARYTGGTYRGYDITLGALHTRIERDNLIERDAHQQTTIEEVRTWVYAQTGPALLFCDGAGKPDELRLYAPLLRSGDVLLGHDLGTEYGEEAIAKMPDTIERVRTEWLSDTLLCLFVPRGEAGVWQ